MNNEMIFTNGEGFNYDATVNYANTWNGNYNYSNEYVDQNNYYQGYTDSSANQVYYSNPYGTYDYSNVESVDYSQENNAQVKKTISKGKVKSAVGLVASKLIKYTYVVAPVAGIVNLISNLKYFQGTGADKAYGIVLVLQCILAIAGGYLSKRLFNDNNMEHSIKFLPAYVGGYIALTLVSKVTAIIAPFACLGIIFFMNKAKYTGSTVKDIILCTLADFATVVALALPIIFVTGVAFLVAASIINVVVTIILKIVGVIVFILLLPFLIRYALYYRV